MLFLLSVIHFFFIVSGHTLPKAEKKKKESWRNGDTYPEYRPPFLSECRAYFSNIIGHQPRYITLAFCPQLRARHLILGFSARLLLMWSKIIVVHACMELPKLILTVSSISVSKTKTLNNYGSGAMNAPSHNKLKRRKSTFTSCN